MTDRVKTTFTDEDWLILKTYAELWIDGRNFIPLIFARLEAAEKALKFALDDDEIVSAKMLEDALEAWRQISGKALPGKK